MPINCRYYENQYPQVDDVVVVTVRSIQEMGAYVQLLEYKNIEGMILLSELSRRRIRSINKLIRVGRNEVVVVIRVDTEKGYIDLSKRRVSAEEAAKCIEKFSDAKTVNQILRHVAELMHFENDGQFENLYIKTAWYFDRKLGRQGASYDVFKQAVTTPSVLDECDIDDDTRKHLLHEIQRRLMPQPVKIRADFEVSCFTYEGIDAIKEALRSGLQVSTEDLPIRINLIAPPLFVMTTQTLERNEGLSQLQKALDTIKATIESKGGSYKIQEPPRVVSALDEAELRRQLSELEEANREVSGDEDEESQEDEEEGEEGDDDEELDAGLRENGGLEEKEGTAVVLGDVEK